MKSAAFTKFEINFPSDFYPQIFVIKNMDVVELKMWIWNIRVRQYLWASSVK